jgi:hypothetical protein
MSSAVILAAVKITHRPSCMLNTQDAAEGYSTFCLQVKEILLHLRILMDPLNQVNLYAQKNSFLMLLQEK